MRILNSYQSYLKEGLSLKIMLILSFSMLQPCALASYSELEDVIQDEVLASFFKSTDLI